MYYAIHSSNKLLKIISKGKRTGKSRWRGNGDYLPIRAPISVIAEGIVSFMLAMMTCIPLIPNITGEGLAPSDLVIFKPTVFDSKQSGHSCNCTFLFQILKEMGIVDEIEGEGKRGNPFYVIIVD